MKNKPTKITFFWLICLIFCTETLTMNMKGFFDNLNHENPKISAKIYSKNSGSVKISAEKVPKKHKTATKNKQDWAEEQNLLKKVSKLDDQPSLAAERHKLTLELKEAHEREKSLLFEQKNSEKNAKKNLKKKRELKLKKKKAEKRKKRAQKLKKERRKLVAEFHDLDSDQQMGKLKDIYKNYGIKIKDLSNKDLKFLIKNTKHLLKMYYSPQAGGQGEDGGAGPGSPGEAPPVVNMGENGGAPDLNGQLASLMQQAGQARKLYDVDDFREKGDLKMTNRILASKSKKKHKRFAKKKHRKLRKHSKSSKNKIRTRKLKNKIRSKKLKNKIHARKLKKSSKKYKKDRGLKKHKPHARSALEASDIPDINPMLMIMSTGAGDYIKANRVTGGSMSVKFPDSPPVIVTNQTPYYST